MIKKTLLAVTVLFSVFAFTSCNEAAKETTENTTDEMAEMQKRVDEYAKFKLTTDLSVLSENQKQMLPILFEVADIMEEIFWKDAIGDKTEFLNSIEEGPVREFAKINYGAWDRMNNNEPFIEGYGKKPVGAKYYPADITKEEFEAFTAEDKMNWYTVIRRNDDGSLKTVPYHLEYPEEIQKAAELLKKAAELADDAGFKKYLELRAEALLTDDYLASDLAWMEMKDNIIDFVVGPIESYEDKFMGVKAAHSGQILIKDVEWSTKLSEYAALLPTLQASLPVDEAYKQEKSKANADINVYDVIYYAGDCNSGGKNIAINLPNDPRVHAVKGSRKLQLRNAMQAKFEKILLPISDILIVEEQRKHIKFESFFENVMFHEVAHGLGVKNKIDGTGTVKDAIQDLYSSIEEGKADVIGLYIITQLYEMGELKDKDLMDNYTTFMAGIFRSIRFGASSAHGKANMICINYFQEQEAFTRDAETGLYRVNFEKMKEAVASLGGIIIKIQGDGDYAAAKKLIDEKGNITETLQSDLDRIQEAGIAVDIVFEQGVEALGL